MRSAHIGLRNYYARFGEANYICVIYVCSIIHYQFKHKFILL